MADLIHSTLRILKIYFKICFYLDHSPRARNQLQARITSEMMDKMIDYQSLFIRIYQKIIKVPLSWGKSGKYTTICLIATESGPSKTHPSLTSS